MNHVNKKAGPRPGLSLALLFFLSGAAGLVYQVLWREELALYFGRTWAATALVLAVFMGGLALGAVVGGALADRLSLPLLVYSFLETALAPMVLLPDYLLEWLRPFYRHSWHALGGEGPLLAGLQLLIAAAALLPATTLMGATLPVLSRFAAKGSFPRELPRLYGANTLGAAVGALAAAFFLIPWLGLPLTRLTAVTVTLAVAFLAARLAKRDLPSVERLKEEMSRRLRGEAPRREPLPPRSMLLAGAAFLSGLLVLALEVFWTQALALNFGSTVYAFGLMLAAFLAGLGLASLLCARLCGRGADPRRLAAFAFCAGGWAVILSTACMGALPWVSAWLVRSFAGHFVGFTVARFLLLFLLLSLPALLLGLALPALVVAARRRGREGADTGFLYGANLAGAVIGPLLAGFLVLPALGSRLGLLGTGVLLLAAGLPLARGRGRKVAAVAAGAGVAALLLLPAWNENLHTSGFHLYALSHPRESLEHALARREPLWVGEGMQGTAAVIDFTDRRGRRHRTYSLNGKYEGSSNPDDMRTQTAVGEIPLLLSTRPAKDVYLLGLGTGATAAAILRHPVERLDICELSPQVVHIAENYFSEVNNRCLEDERLNLELADGRHWLGLQERQWDAVISEPSNPWMAGVASLYTLQSFREMRARTRAGGVVCQWVQGYLITEETFRTVLRTWLEVFPRSLALLPHREVNDVILLGFVDDTPGERRIALDLAEMEARLDHRGPYPFGKEYAPTDAISVFQAFLMGPDRLAEYAGEGPLHRDDRPLLQYEAPLELYRMQAEIKRWPRLPGLIEPPHDYLAGLDVERGANLFNQHLALAVRLFLGGAGREARMLPTTAVAGLVEHMRSAASDPRCRDRWLPLWLAGHFLLYGEKAGEPGSSRIYGRGWPRWEALDLLSRATQADPERWQPFVDLAQALARGTDGELGGPGCDPPGALKVTARALALRPLQREAVLLRAKLLYSLDRTKEAIALLRDYTREKDTDPEAQELLERLLRVPIPD